MESITNKTIQFGNVTTNSFDATYKATFTPGTNAPYTGSISLFLGSSIVAADSYSESFSSETTVSKTYSVSNVSPNTAYGYKVGATLKDKDDNVTAYSGPSTTRSVTTKAEMPTLTVAAITESSVTVGYSALADGGVYDKEIQYSLDNGATWSTGATVSTGSASSGTFTIAGLSASTTYSIQTRVKTTAGSSTGATLSVTTADSPVKLYGPAPVQTVTGVTGEIRSGGAGNIAAFDANAFWTYASSSLNSTAVDYLQVQCDGQDYRLSIWYTDGTARQSLYGWDSASGLASYGITISGSVASDDYIDLTPIYAPTGSYVTKEVQKLYGSVNGQTKLITKLYGSVNGLTKLIYQE